MRGVDSRGVEQSHSGCRQHRARFRLTTVNCRPQPPTRSRTTTRLAISAREPPSGVGEVVDGSGPLQRIPGLAPTPTAPQCRLRGHHVTPNGNGSYQRGRQPSPVGPHLPRAGYRRGGTPTLIILIKHSTEGHDRVLRQPENGTNTLTFSYTGPSRRTAFERHRSKPNACSVHGRTDQGSAGKHRGATTPSLPTRGAQGRPRPRPRSRPLAIAVPQTCAGRRHHHQRDLQ